MLKRATEFLVGLIIIGYVLSGCSISKIHIPQPVDLTKLPRSTETQKKAPVSSETGVEVQVTYPTLETTTQDTYPMESLPTGTSLEKIQPPRSAPIPDSELASVSGLIYAFDISVVLTNTTFYLSPALMIDGIPTVSPIITSPSIDNGDFVANTDAMGKFEINNINPGNYYLMINYPDHTVIGLMSQNTSQILLISLEAGSRVPLGVVFVQK